MYQDLVTFIRERYNEPHKFITLHEAKFIGNELKYMEECIATGMVSSVGKFVDRFEDEIKKYTGAKYAVATVNGTSALHMALLLAGVGKNDLVITQALTFVATCNAISYTGATPVFVDVSLNNLGMDYLSLENYLKKNVVLKNGLSTHIITGQKIAACVPMHSYGHPAEIIKIVELCTAYGIPVIEDAAESLGSTYHGQHTGTFGKLGIYSFNGNKTITSGGGGMIVTNDEELAVLGKHLTTQAKSGHRWEFNHDQVGYNYRLPNINAALGCAQLENIEVIIAKQRELNKIYQQFFNQHNIAFVNEPSEARSNCWMNAFYVDNKIERDKCLTFLNDHGIMARPAWTMLNKLAMYNTCHCENLQNSQMVEDTLITIPSTVVL